MTSIKFDINKLNNFSYNDTVPVFMLKLCETNTRVVMPFKLDESN